MRTTLNLDDDLVRDAKIRAIQERTTLSEMVERALRQILEDGEREWQDLPVYHVGKILLPPDIDINDTSAVMDYLDVLDANS
jgi:hypothetical protein